MGSVLSFLISSAGAVVVFVERRLGLRLLYFIPLKNIMFIHRSDVYIYMLTL